MIKENLWSLGYMVCGYLLLTVSVYHFDFLLKSIFLCCGVYWVCKGLININGDDGMTEKRFAEVKGYCYDKKTCIGVIQDDYTCKNMINLLNEQEETINELKTRNNRQYERLKELTDLMFKRDWKTLETMVDEWEREDEYLRKYGG